MVPSCVSVFALTSECYSSRVVLRLYCASRVVLRLYCGSSAQELCLKRAQSLYSAKLAMKRRRARSYEWCRRREHEGRRCSVRRRGTYGKVI